MLTGIYCIRNLFNDKIYVGSSKNIKVRWKRHQSELRDNKHHNVYLSRSYLKYGTGCFEYFMLECGVLQENLFDRERYWINELVPEYNIGGVCGGDSFTNHPDKERIREVHRKNLQKLWDEGRVPKTESCGGNPNWRGGISGKDLCNGCGKEKKARSDLCKSCADQNRDGIKNPFYGKAHSVEMKDVASERMKGKVPTNARLVYWRGRVYKSATELGRLLGKSNSTISYRCRNGLYGTYYLEQIPVKVIS